MDHSQADRTIWTECVPVDTSLVYDDSFGALSSG